MSGASSRKTAAGAAAGVPSVISRNDYMGHRLINEIICLLGIAKLAGASVSL